MTTLTRREKRLLLQRIRLIRKERDTVFKKLAWRFVRGGVYVFLSGVAAKYAPILGPELTAAAVGGILSAVDKALGIGRLVPAPTK